MFCIFYFKLFWRLWFVTYLLFHLSDELAKTWQSFLQDCDLLKTYLAKIHDLEGELLHLKNLSSQGSRVVDCIDSDDDDFRPKSALFPCVNEYSSGDISGKIWKL